jgi:hypothetical protein
MRFGILVLDGRCCGSLRSCDEAVSRCHNALFKSESIGTTNPAGCNRLQNASKNDNRMIRSTGCGHAA